MVLVCRRFGYVTVYFSRPNNVNVRNVYRHFDQRFGNWMLCQLQTKITTICNEVI